MTFLNFPRFDDKIEPVPECGCWLWTGVVNSRGYGMIKVCGVMVYAHIFAWRRHHGRPVPKGHVLMHSCDTRRCCNPAHLKPGTHRANMRDMVSKGRAASRVNGRHAVCKLVYRIAHGFMMEEI